RTYSNSEIAEAVNRAFANPHPVRLTAADPPEKAGGFMDITRAAQELGWRPRWELSAALTDMKNQLDQGVYCLPH
ncbi:MAG: hypothetical protein ONB12_05720, partial [candidate division KSB1 bacterium]|nr:hypothetical protein [candidate division KSB1 bacterium]